MRPEKSILHFTFRRDIVLNCSIMEDPSLGMKQPFASFQLAGIEPFAQIFHSLRRSFGHFLLMNMKLLNASPNMNVDMLKLNLRVCTLCPLYNYTKNDHRSKV